MSKNRVIFNIQNASVGPAPATGYHFINASGILNNNLNSSNTNFNLIMPLVRITNFNYELNSEYLDYQAIGFYGPVERKIISIPTATFSLSYNQISMINEARLGFYVNHRRYDGDYSGAPKYSNNFGVFCLSGFLPQTPTPENNDLNWPLSYRDRRNIFLSVGKTTSDLNVSTFNPENVDVVGFGNCYITNYSTRAAVGQFPACSVSYIAENIQFYNNGSGGIVPALHPKSGQNMQGVNFKVPSHARSGNSPSILRPSDITVSVSRIPSFTGVSSLVGTGFSNGASSTTINSLQQDFGDLPIQSYSINIPLNRNPLRSLTHRLPIDRKLVFPIFAEINFSTLQTDMVTGSAIDLCNKNFDYNLTFKINSTQLNNWETGVSIQYDVLRAKYINSSLDSSIGPNNLLSYGYLVELTPNNFNRGLFMSGALNISPIGEFYDIILDESNNPILNEGNGQIDQSSYKFYY